MSDQAENGIQTATVEAPEQTSSTTETGSANCPRCGSKLLAPENLGWCAACGYSRALEAEEKAKPVVPPPSAVRPPRHSPLGVVEFFQILATLPGWVWVLLGGAVGIVAASLVISHFLPGASFSRTAHQEVIGNVLYSTHNRVEESFWRALWSTVQLGLGAILIFVAQAWGVILIGSEEEKIGMKDCIIPGRLWVLLCRRLPRTRGPVWLASWALTAILSAFLVIGGMNYWMPSKEPPPKPQKVQKQKRFVANPVAAPMKAAT